MWREQKGTARSGSSTIGCGSLNGAFDIYTLLPCLPADAHWRSICSRLAGAARSAAAVLRHGMAGVAVLPAVSACFVMGCGALLPAVNVRWGVVWSPLACPT